jgi:hypothetical protein
MEGDRHRAPRFEIDQMIELSYGREQFVRSRGVNLSATGLLCRTDEPLAAGVTLELMLSLKEVPAVTIRCEGVVVRSVKSGGGYETGIAFTEMGAESREALETFTRKHGA